MDNETKNNVTDGYVPAENDRYIPETYRNQVKTKNPVAAILISILIMVVFIAIQVLVLLPIEVFQIFDIIGENAGNSALDPDQLTDILFNRMDVVGLSLIATLVSTCVAVLWYRLAYCRKYGLGELKASCKRIFGGLTLPGIVFAAIAMFYLTNFIVILIGMIMPGALEDYSELVDMIGIGDEMNWQVIVMTVVLAPINEECIMRGLILTKLKRNMAPVLAVIISAVLFGVFHMNLVQGIYAGFLGLFMGYLAYKYNSIMPAMLFHAIFNSLNFVLSLLPQAFTDNEIVAIVIPVIFGLGWYFTEGRRNLRDDADFS